ncbi:MAG: protein kinase, partial [Polyangiales bacterium]
VANNGRVKLIDFGIAKAARSRVQTAAGTIKGKLAYVAPEYTYGKLDARADLFAVGAVAHEMLTGHRLFAAATEIATIQNVRQLVIAPPSRHDRKVTRDLDDIVLTALQRDPDQRWQNAAAMGRALRGVADEIGRVDAREILRWVEWAFTREPWSESGVGRILDTLEVTRANVPAVREREAPATIPAIPALLRKPKFKEPPAEDEDAPTYEDAPATEAFTKPENTQLTKRAQATWTRILLVMLMLLGAIVAYGRWSGRL